MKLPQLAATVVASALAAAPGHADPIPSHFESTGEDLKAINTLLANYTKAVSTKDQTLFETLLLDPSIPFASIPAAGKTGADHETRKYEAFRKAVFEGEPFTQQFRDVHIEQDGGLANVTLVFENARPTGKSWGWKTMHLLKVDGRWKIASEFYSSHAVK
ncbi:MAG: nuclear transport factor 2 family protein [Acetobacteraceae bacterium]